MPQFDTSTPKVQTALDQLAVELERLSEALMALSFELDDKAFATTLRNDPARRRALEQQMQDILAKASVR